MTIVLHQLKQWVRWILYRRISRKAKILFGAGLNITLLSIVAVIIYRYQDLLPVLRQSLSIPSVMGCLSLYLISFLVQGGVWIDMMGYRRSDWHTAINDYVQTNLMGRLPGGWWKFLGRVTIYRASHVSIRTIVAINLFELLLLLLAGASLLTLVALTSWPVKMALIASQFSIAIVLIRYLVVAVPHLKRRSAGRILFWYGAYAFAWWCGALILHLIAVPFSPSSFRVTDAVRLATLSGIVNMAFQFLPVNLLFRDLTLFTLLEPFMSFSHAIVLIFALRLIYSIGELLSSWLVIGCARMLRWSNSSSSLEKSSDALT